MRVVPAGVASAVHFILAPGVVIGLVPWLLTGWEPGGTGSYGWILRFIGGLLVVVGVLVVAAEFVRFTIEGRGSPAPPAPTERLVVGGLYDRVRNPMYVAVVTAVLGQALLLARPVLLVYAAVLCVVVVAFVRGYEEPTLRRQFGAEYDAYCQRVPAWLPRLR